TGRKCRCYLVKPPPASGSCIGRLGPCPVRLRTDDVDVYVVRVGLRGSGTLVATGLHQAGDGRGGQRDDDDGERQPDRDVRGPADRLATVDERKFVAVQVLQHELHADEREDGREPVGQVTQTVEQATEQEEQLTEAHQREDVGGEDDVRLLGQAEDRRDRV